MAELPYMPFFPNDFFGDTAHVPPDVAAYYMVLLAHAWMRGGSLPNNEDQLRLMTRLTGHRWRAIRDDILAFFVVGEDGRLHQKRMDKEWNRVAEARAASSASGHTNGSAERRKARDNILSAKIVEEHDGKNPNDFYARARPVPTSYTQNHKEEEEDARDARGRALTRDASSGFKNGRGRKGRYGQNRKPSAADVAWQNLVDFERECLERRAAREQGTESEASRPLDFELLPKVRH